MTLREIELLEKIMDAKIEKSKLDHTRRTYLDVAIETHRRELHALAIQQHRYNA